MKITMCISCSVWNPQERFAPEIGKQIEKEWKEARISTTLHRDKESFRLLLLLLLLPLLASSSSCPSSCFRGKICQVFFVVEIRASNQRRPPIRPIYLLCRLVWTLSCLPVCLPSLPPLSTIASCTPTPVKQRLISNANCSCLYKNDGSRFIKYKWWRCPCLPA